MQENDFLADILCNDDAQYIPELRVIIYLLEDFHYKI